MSLFDGGDFKHTDGIVRQDIKEDGIPAGYMYPAMPVLKYFHIPGGSWIGERNDMFLYQFPIGILEIVDKFQCFFVDDNLHIYP